MKKIILIIFLLSSLPSFAQMVPQWKHKFGMPVYNGGYPWGMQFDDSSNVYIFDDVINLAGAETECFEPVVKKLNKNGQLVWYKNFGATHCSEEHAYGLEKDQHGFFYALYKRSDIGYALTKFDNNGTIIWNNTIGLNLNYIYDCSTKLKKSSSGVFYVNVNRYNRNLILKINQAGSLIDSIVVNSPGEISNFEISPSNKLMVFAKTNTVFPYESSVFYIDSLHNLLWQKPLGVFAIYSASVIKSDSEIYTAFYGYGEGNKIHVLKISNGNAVWSNVSTYGAVLDWNGWTTYPKLMQDNDGNLIFAGNQIISGVRNSFFVTKINKTNGNEIWKINLAQYNADSYLMDLAKDSSGNYYACGRIGFSNYQTGNSYGVIKFSPGGNILRTTLNEGYFYSSFLPEYIGITKTNDVVIAGPAADTGSFYAQSLTIKYSQPVNITPNTNTLPNNFSLNQNYPNPFNPNTVISLKLPVGSFVSLKVYDINGREVSELVNEKLNPGKYKIDFNGSNLPSGVYYYKMSTESFSETKKMILVK
jgi:hypothetical protein